ncbi:DUF1534 domain-containing protein [Pseudomonas sp. AN3A02]|nr:DUF1534 domain-containing protein [Pseudomonas sp. AN3A02]
MVSPLVPTLCVGNASCDAPRHDFKSGRRASRVAFPHGAWERSVSGI